MKRKMISILLAVILCLTLAVPAFAAGSGDTAAKLFNPAWLIGCIVVGFLIALIPMGVLKGQIRNVHSKSQAEDYTRDDSFHLTVKQDIFLYKNVDKTPIPKNNNNH